MESSDEFVEKRLETLLAINYQTAQEKALFSSETERIAALSMRHPLSPEKTFAYFGLLLGIFPPMALFVRFFTGKGIFRSEDFWILGVVAIINLIAAIVGYFSGKLIGKIVGELEKLSWTAMLLTLPFIGILWGILAGAAGGVIVFVFGAFFGAILGAAVGGAALTVFAPLHRLIKHSDKIERRQFLPIAFGVTFAISAFILGA